MDAESGESTEETDWLDSLCLTVGESVTETGMRLQYNIIKSFITDGRDTACIGDPASIYTNDLDPQLLLKIRLVSEDIQ